MRRGACVSSTTSVMTGAGAFCARAPVTTPAIATIIARRKNLGKEILVMRALDFVNRNRWDSAREVTQYQFNDPALSNGIAHRDRALVPEAPYREDEKMAGRMRKPEWVY